MNRKMAEAVLPMLMFVVIREVLGSLLAILQAVLLQQADAGVLAFVSVHDADLRALSGAISMAGAFALTLWNARGEVNLQSGCSGEAMSGERLRARGDQLIAAAAGILAASVFLNLFLAGVGAVHADAAAADASAQAGRVSLPLGILIYGVLSPLAEETVFRGITLQRLYLLCHEKKKRKNSIPAGSGPLLVIVRYLSRKPCAGAVCSRHGLSFLPVSRAWRKSFPCYRSARRCECDDAFSFSGGDLPQGFCVCDGRRFWNCFLLRRICAILKEA